MARIRSIHPGLFTDEAFMSASAYARLLILGIWTEAWDDGVFEWKPLTLKARIFPVDNVDLPALLSELTELRFVCKFSTGGRDFGAIRNFRKYQKPKTPNSSGVLPPDLVSFVAMPSEPLPNHFGNASEKPLLMEDGGGKEEGKKEKEKEKEKEPSSETSSDLLAEQEAQKPTAKKKTNYPPDFEKLWGDYPTDSLMSKKACFDVWKRLDAEDRDKAMRGIPALIAHAKANPTYRMVHACRYLSQRRFDGLAEASNVIPITQEFTSDEAWFESLRARRASAGVV